MLHYPRKRLASALLPIYTPKGPEHKDSTGPWIWMRQRSVRVHALVAQPARLAISIRTRPAREAVPNQGVDVREAISTWRRGSQWHSPELVQVAGGGTMVRCASYRGAGD